MISLIDNEFCMKYIKNIDLCRKWLVLAVLALACSGVLSIATVILRMPAVNDLIGGQNVFDSALIIHVNLSVLVWMLSILSIMWATIIDKQYSHITNKAWWFGIIGVSFIAFSIFIPNSVPVKNNYIPILHNIVFLLGLGLFTSSILSNAILVIMCVRVRDAIEIGIYCSALFVILAFICILAAYQTIPHGVDLHGFYEYLFWGGGHILQFAYTQALVIVYMAILQVKNTPFLRILFIINALLVLPAALIYLIYPAFEPELTEFFTTHMKYIGGLLPLIVILYSCRHLKFSLYYANAGLIWSIGLFIYGGWLGVTINEITVTVPAHYHGSVVGITMAFIAFAYLLLSRLGFAAISNKMANIQIFMYGIGQTMHISGLAWMGGYGALRKTAGMILPIEAHIGRIIFVIGGSIAIIAGLMFIIMMIKACRNIITYK